MSIRNEYLTGAENKFTDRFHIDRSGVLTGQIGLVLVRMLNLVVMSSHPSSVISQVLDAIQPVMNKGSARDQSVFRAKFSSITDTDIWNAMNRLGEPNKNEALSVDARQELDLRIGCAFTRWASSLTQLACSFSLAASTQSLKFCSTANRRAGRRRKKVLSC